MLVVTHGRVAVAFGAVTCSQVNLSDNQLSGTVPASLLALQSGCVLPPARPLALHALTHLSACICVCLCVCGVVQRAGAPAAGWQPVLWAGGLRAVAGLPCVRPLPLRRPPRAPIIARVCVCVCLHAASVVSS